MTVPVQGPDGNLYQFPDGTTKERAIAYFRTKGIGMQSTAPPNAGLARPAGAPPSPQQAAGKMQTGRTPLLTSYGSQMSKMPAGVYHQANATLNPFSEDAKKMYGEDDRLTAEDLAGKHSTADILKSLYEKYTPIAKTSPRPDSPIDWGATAANLTPMAASVVGGKALGMLNRKIVPLNVAAEELTNAVNPVPEKMGKYQSELAKHFDKIKTFAVQKGINIDSREGLGRAMKTAGDSIRDHYYEKILGPVKELPVDVTSVPGYSGKTATSPSTATLADLDARLSQINAELNPKFAKGGIAGQAAVKSAGDLNAEASAIRSVLYPRLAQATGLTPEVIAQTRQAFGSLDSLAEQTHSAATKARFATNKEASAPLSVNPFAGSKGKQFVADKAIQKVMGDPVKKAIQNAVSRADVPRYRLPEPDPVAARSALRPPRQPPIRGVSKAAGKVVETSPEEVAEHAKKFGEREAQVLKSRNKTLRRPIWADIGTGGTTPAP